MLKPVASLIISVYNNTEFLGVVLDSLKFQTDQRFEVIISEDAEHESIRSFIETYHFEGSLYHLTQPDTGWQKNKALNKASVFAHTNQLIYIDGDCVLHPRFMEFHIKLFNEDSILAGKRIKLDKMSSQRLIRNSNTIPDFQNYLFRNYRAMKRQGAGFIEEGFFISPTSVLGFIPKLRSMYQLKGCNMSFSKKALYDINGFDEDYIRPAIGEDIDLMWRFAGKGYQIKSVRNLAVQYHLYHTENWNNQDDNILMMNKKENQSLFKCLNGIIKNT